MTAIARIDFHGSQLVTLRHDGRHLVAMRPIVDSIGLDWKAQYNRIRRHPVLSTSVVMMTMQLPGDPQRRQVLCLPLDYLNGWLFGIDVNRCREDVRPLLLAYQRECYAVLAAHWQNGGSAKQLDIFDHEAIEAARKAYVDWSWEAHKRMRDAGIEFPQVPAGVEQAALEAALADAMMTARFMLTFDDDYRMQIKPVPRDCVVMSLEGVAKYLADPSAMPRREAVSAIAQAAVGRLARM